MNTQDINTQYPVMEHFYTIQGEGAYTGSAAYFIRLGGCDVGCVWCDVKESWDATAHPSMGSAELCSLLRESGTGICVITGGEPAMYNLEPLIAQIQLLGIRVHVETSGAYELQGSPDWICLSPKKFKAPLASMLKRADEFKAVVYHRSDMAWAASFLPDLKRACLLFLQPEWSRHEQINPLLIDYVKAHPQWRISLQTHKYLNIP